MSINRLLSKVKRLPATPELLPKLMQVLKDPNNSSEEIVEMIKLDMSLAAQIQHMSNSPYYGFSSPSKDLGQAIARIGLQETYKLVAAVLSQQMMAKSLKMRYLSSNILWQNSIAAAKTMEFLGEEDTPDSVNHYSIGLFHNIGLHLMAHAEPQLLDQAIEQTKKEKIHLLDAMRNTFEFDHLELAQALLERWQFPEAISEPIAYQFHPDHAPLETKTAAMLCLTHFILHTMNCEISGNTVANETINYAQETVLNIDDERLHIFVEKAEKAVSDIGEMFKAGQKA